MNANIHYVNNTVSDISMLFHYLKEAYQTGVLHEDVADLFSIKFLTGMNDDGSRRMIVDAV